LIASFYPSELNTSMKKSKSKNPWKTLSRTEVYNNPWIKVEEHRVINPGAREGIYGKVFYKNKAIGIVALDENDNTWLVGQHRYPLNQWSWEIPEGGGPAGKTPLYSAKRELKEEAGLTAGSWKMIVRTHLSNSVSDEEGFIFLARDITEGLCAREDSEADMKLWKLPFKKVLQMVLNGTITDSLSVMGILRVARHLGL
jgi:8-oxo-dGTP pyrophosphatase MutT (NUDIX family)